MATKKTSAAPEAKNKARAAAKHTRTEANRARRLAKHAKRVAKHPACESRGMARALLRQQQGVSKELARLLKGKRIEATTSRRAEPSTRKAEPLIHINGQPIHSVGQAMFAIRQIMQRNAEERKQAVPA